MNFFDLTGCRFRVIQVLPCRRLYPQLVDALKSLKARSFIVDGEIAALDEKGRSSFQLLQSYSVAKGIPLVYHVFDLLSLEGTDMRSRPLVERRELVAKPSSF